MLGLQFSHVGLQLLDGLIPSDVFRVKLIIVCVHQQTVLAVEQSIVIFITRLHGSAFLLKMHQLVKSEQLLHQGLVILLQAVEGPGWLSSVLGALIEVA